MVESSIDSGDNVIKRWLVVLSLVIMLTCDKIGDCRMQVITPNDYITMELDCSKDQIKVIARTLDPFTGVLYIEDPQQVKKGASSISRKCRVTGGGSHEVGLTVPQGDCGWLQDPENPEYVQLNLYLQYDAYVQQVIDESLLVTCDMRKGDGTVDLAGGANTFLVAKSSMNSIPMQGKLLEAKLEFETEPIKTFRKNKNNNIIVGRNRKDDFMRNREDDIVRNREDDIVKNREDDILRPYKVEDNIISKGRRENEITVDISGSDLTQSTFAQEDNMIYDDIRGFMEVWGGRRGEEGANLLEPGSNATILVRTWGRPQPDPRMGHCLLYTESDVVQLTDKYGCGSGMSGRSVRSDVIEMSYTFTVPETPGAAKLHCKVISCTGCLGLCQPGKLFRTGRSDRQVEEILELETEIYIVTGVSTKARVEPQSDPEMEETKKSMSLIEKIQNDTELCLSPSRLILSFSVLILVLVLALLASCILWVKARASVRPRHKLPRAAMASAGVPRRPPYMLPAPRNSPYIRVMQ